MSSITSAKGNNQTRTRGVQDAPVIDRAKEFVGAAADRAKEVMGAAADRVEAAAASVTRKADQVAATAGSNIRGAGEAIKQQGPQEGMLGSAAKSVGGAIEAGGRYLEEQGFTGMVDDVAGVIKRNPVPAIIVGVGLGILIGRALRR